jgi:hypothetical protein
LENNLFTAIKEGEMDKENITITKDEYRRLLNAEDKLSCLESCGVDNWSGYDDAMEMMRSGRTE